jgi:two-component system, sensor histidine kinase and response regulator
MELKAKILIVDDEEGIQKGCRRVLAEHGFHLEAASTIKEGLQKFQDSSFDLVLLDVMLPDGKGIDIIPRLHESDPDLVCVVMTGYATVELAVQAMKAGAYNFITKPFSADLLLLAVNQGLEKRQLSRDVKRLKSFEHEVSQLWSLAKGELDGFDQLNKDFIGPAAFRLTIAHEFRAPITALLSFLILLRKGYVPADQQDKIIDSAIERAQDLLDLVDDLMNLTTAKEELSPENRKLHHLSDDLEKVVPTLKAQAEEKGLQFSMEIKNRPLVETNPMLMDQLWTNLISNAIKYTLPGGRVTVVLDEQEGWAIGSVADTGIGMSPSEQNLIFHEFYRAPRAKEMERHGSGLGLSFVKRIIEGYNGTLDVRSEVDQGSCIQFRLPMAKGNG